MSGTDRNIQKNNIHIMSFHCRHFKANHFNVPQSIVHRHCMARLKKTTTKKSNLDQSKKRPHLYNDKKCCKFFRNPQDISPF